MFLQSIYQPKKVLNLVKNASTHQTGGCVGHRAVMDILENRKICCISSYYRNFTSLTH